MAFRSLDEFELLEKEEEPLAEAPPKTPESPPQKPKKSPTTWVAKVVYFDDGQERN